MLRYVWHLLGIFCWRGRASVVEYWAVGLACLGAAIIELITFKALPRPWIIPSAVVIAYVACSNLTRRFHDVNVRGAVGSALLVTSIGLFGAALAMVIGYGSGAPSWAEIIVYFTVYIFWLPFSYFMFFEDPVVEGNRFGPVPPWTSKEALRKRPLQPSTQRFRRRVKAAQRVALRLEDSETPTKSLLGGPVDPTFGLPPRLRCLARIDLSEVHAAGGPAWLPSTGVLFFYAADEDWSDPADWRVVHVDRSPDISATPATFLSMALTTAYPSIEWMDALDDIEDSDLDSQVIWEEERRVDGHCLGGYPAEIQDGCLALACELGLQGEQRSPYEVYSDEDARKRAAASARRKWRLLLQLEDDRRLRINFGDGGKLWFFVREADARRGDFSNVWLLHQTY